MLALGVLAERIDDPDLAGPNSGGESSGVLVAWDELDVLDTGTVGNGDSADDLAGIEFPKAESISLLDSKRRGRLENGDGNNEVRGEDELLVPVNGETVWAELLAENVQGGTNIFGPLVNLCDSQLCCNQKVV